MNCVPACSNLERIEEAIGDKLGLFIQSLAQFIAGFVIAFAYAWKLALVMSILSPLIAAGGFVMGKVCAGPRLECLPSVTDGLKHNNIRN